MTNVKCMHLFSMFTLKINQSIYTNPSACLKGHTRPQDDDARQLFGLSTARARYSRSLIPERKNERSPHGNFATQSILSMTIATILNSMQCQTSAGRYKIKWSKLPFCFIVEFVVMQTIVFPSEGSYQTAQLK